MRVWSGLFARLPSAPLRVSGKGLDWQWVLPQGTSITDADCPGARRFAFVAGAVPAYAPCAPAYAEPAADSGDTGEPGFWSRLFGRDKPAEPAQAEPAGSATTPAP